MEQDIEIYFKKASDVIEVLKNASEVCVDFDKNKLKLIQKYGKAKLSNAIDNNEKTEKFCDEVDMYAEILKRFI